MTADRQAISQFLEDADFSGYQAIPLPHGLSLPGADRRPTADVVFSGGVAGKSVLDVGTHYGYFCSEAIRRGAAKAVGVEADAERYSVARQVAEFHGNTYSVVHAPAENLPFDEAFDLVLVLNLLHHLVDPVSVLLALSRLCREQLVVELCTPNDPAYLRCLFKRSNREHLLDAVACYGESALLWLLCRRLPLIAVGNRPLHRGYYFSREAFYNLFVLHHRVFDEVRFVRSPMSAHRVIAFCRVRPAQTAVAAAPGPPA
jgi:SAM-dependent methyltransferase